MIDKATLCTLIPHAGDMCLLDVVTDWNTDGIRCRSDSHRLEHNPLRREDGTLGSAHLLEYAAQAAAIHGGLLAAADQASSRPGYLVSTRQLRLGTNRLDTLQGSLEIEAHRLFSGPGGWIYEFRVVHADRELASGQFTIAHLDAASEEPPA